MSDATDPRELAEYHRRMAVRIIGQMSCGDDNDTRRAIRKEAKVHSDVAAALTAALDRAEKAEAERDAAYAKGRAEGRCTMTHRYTSQKVYIASKTKHAHKWRHLRACGFTINSTWIDESEPGQTTCFIDLWTRCIEEVRDAAFLVAYRETGEVLKGAFIEIGAALALGKHVCLVGDFTGLSFQHHPLIRTFSGSVSDAILMMGATDYHLPPTQGK